MSGYVWQRWLAREFRAAGLTVIELDGWENRGRPASTGSFDPRGPLTKHHTGATSSAARPNPSLATLVQGRPDLPGPLCQWCVRHDGVVVVIAAGRANHAGRVGKSGALGMPLGADGNALALGDEVDTNGTQTMPAVQRHAVDLTAAVALAHYDKGAAWLHRHADISSTGKWDLGGVTTAGLRASTAKLLDRLGKPDNETNVELARATIRRGLRVIAEGVTRLERVPKGRPAAGTMLVAVKAGTAAIRAALKAGPKR